MPTKVVMGLVLALMFVIITTATAEQPVGPLTQGEIVLQGVVVSVTDQSLLLRTYDGRSVFVNLAGIPPEATPFLTEGQRVAVLGYFGQSDTVFIARDIQRTG
jgi:cytochrome c-type biogenesis protein CcmE